MGSLILLLLVMDRRAKAVAVAKARREIARIVEARTAAEAAQTADAQRRRQAQHEALEKEKQDVIVQLQSVCGEIARSEEQGDVMLAGYRSLQTSLQDQEEKLKKLQQDLGEERNRIQEEQSQSSSSSANLMRLGAELQELERTLANLKALRQKEQQTYSLVPYGGKRGDNRRPLYVECAAEGLIFHPDKKVLDRWGLAPTTIRAETEHRIDKQRAYLVKTNAKLDQKPYLLMLVRPDGIVSYYKAIAALQGLDVDYGYEFIERDWALDFPENEETAKPQPWATARTPSLIATSAPSSNAGRQPPVQGIPSLGISGAKSNTTMGGLPTIGASGSIPAGAGLTVMGAPGPPGLSPGYGGISAVPGAGSVTTGKTRQTIAASGSAPGGTSQGTPGGSSSDTAGTPGFGGRTGAGEPSQGTWNRAGGNVSSRPRGPDLAVPIVGSSGTPGLHDSDLPGGLANGEGSNPTSAANPGAGLSSSRSDGVGLRIDGSPAGRPRGPDLAVPIAGTVGGANASPTGPAGPNLPNAPPTGGSMSSANPGAAERQSPTLPMVGGIGPGTSGPSSSAGPIVDMAGQVSGGSTSSGTATAQASRGSRGDAGGTSANANSLAAPGTGAAAVAPEASAPPQTASWAATTRQDPATAGSAPPGTVAAQGAADGGGGGLPIDPRMLAPKTSQPRLPLYTRLTGGRDWIITIECLTDGVVLRPLGQRFGVESLRAGEDNNALSRAVREMIERRQASVRPGEMPYRPQIRFLVKPPDGLRSYYAAYPALESLQLTMTRENFVPVDESKLPPKRKE
jgi:hypothetical protein